jgi:hypothetical protein
MRDGTIVGSLEAEEHDPEDLEGWESQPPDLDDEEGSEEKQEEDDLVD